MSIRLLGTLVVIAILSFSGLIAAYIAHDNWGTTPISLTQEVIIEFPRGTSLAALSNTLVAEKLVAHEKLFQLWVRLHSDYSRFQAGTYKFEGEVSPQDISEKIIQGIAYNPVVLELRIPEGATLKQVIDRLAAGGVASVEELDRLARDPNFLTSLGINALSLEGYLYPATYSFTQIPTPEEALRKPVDTFWNRLPKNYEENVNGLGLSLDEAVRFASLIELETPRDDERSLISEVIWRRLKENIPLGIDAAVIYGIKDYDGNIRTVHLRDASNPYNLRIHPGLPPSAIGSPSIASLQAVFTPAHEGNYYYVLDAKDFTRHRFSKTVTEHNRYVREYVAELRRRRRD